MATWLASTASTSSSWSSKISPESFSPTRGIPGNFPLVLRGPDQGRFDRVDLFFARLEVARDLGVELRLFLDHPPPLLVEPLHDRAIDPDRCDAGALADGRVLAVDDERAALGIEDHQHAVG